MAFGLGKEEIGKFLGRWAEFSDDVAVPQVNPDLVVLVYHNEVRRSPGTPVSYSVNSIVAWSNRTILSA